MIRESKYKEIHGYESFYPIDNYVSSTMNKIFEAPKDGDWTDQLIKELPNEFVALFPVRKELSKLLISLSRITVTIDADLLNYKEFITDGASGIPVEHYLSDLLLHLSEKARVAYHPPKEVTIQGGAGSWKRIDAIKNVLQREGVTPSRSTLFITEYIMTGDNLAEMFSQIEGFNKMDILSLGTKINSTAIRAKFNLDPKTKIYSGGSAVHFKNEDEQIGFEKYTQRQEREVEEMYISSGWKPGTYTLPSDGGYMNANLNPDSAKSDSYRHLREGLNHIAQRFVNLIEV